jgi:hypothetical protein
MVVDDDAHVYGVFTSQDFLHRLTAPSAWSIDSTLTHFLHRLPAPSAWSINSTLTHFLRRVVLQGLNPANVMLEDVATMQKVGQSNNSSC